ncbi:MAG: FAD binding domain-containing protein [Pseudomonadota bacterium]
MPYLRPRHLDDALAVLEQDGWRIAAGCTDVLPATAAKTLPGPTLDITGIEGLRGIGRGDDGWIIGATTTWTDVVRADLPPAFRGLQLAARAVGAMQIQNCGTVGGNLCNASPAADGVPPLLTLGAEVELRSTGGARRLALSEFITGPRRTGRHPTELMTAIHVPEHAAAGEGHFLKLGARDYLVISIAMCAVRLVVREGTVIEAALSVGACGPVATRLPKVEAALIGHAPDPANIADAEVFSALSPVSDIRADAAYRAAVAAEMLRRAVLAVPTAEVCAA